MTGTTGEIPVSVITGYYNRGPLVARTVESILAQTFGDFELIVFDDCSSDDTQDQLARYDDPRLKVIRHQTNKGFVQGMIDAIAVSQGRYVAVQGSGDVSMPTRLERQVEVLETMPDVGVVGCHYENVIEDEGIRRLRTPTVDGLTVEGLRRSNVFSHGEVTYRRAVYDAVGGYRPEFVNSQDYDLWLRMIRECRFEIVPEVLYHRFVQFDGVSYAPDKLIRQTRFALLAQDLSRLDTEAQGRRLAEVRAGKLDAIVPIEDRRLQVTVFRAVCRAIAWNNLDQARALSREYLMPGKLRRLAAILLAAFGSPAKPLLDWLLFKIAGITRAGG